MAHPSWAVHFCGDFDRATAQLPCAGSVAVDAARVQPLECGVLVFCAAAYESLAAALTLWCREWISGLALPTALKHMACQESLLCWVWQQRLFGCCTYASGSI